MSNYIAVDYDQAKPQLKAIYDDYKVTTGNTILPNWLKYLGEMPHLVKGVWGLVRTMMIDSQLSPLLQELIFFSVAHYRTAPYCMELHGNNLLRMTKNLTFADLKAIVTGQSRGYLPKKYVTASQIAGKLSIAECSLSQSEFDKLSEAGFSQKESMEITMLVSVAVFFNTYTFAADLPIENRK